MADRVAVRVAESKEIKEILVPDIGDFDVVDVVEVLVAVGDEVSIDDSLITLESDKASMEVPSPFSGIIQSIDVDLGDQVGEGALIARVGVAPAKDSPAESAPAPTAKSAPAAKSTPDTEALAKPSPPPARPAPSQSSASRPGPAQSLADPPKKTALPHASPSIRMFARELGVGLERVPGSGPKGRILREDVQAFVKAEMSAGAGAAGSGSSIPTIPAVDFSKFGEVETRPLSRIRRLAAKSVHRSWLNVPHVTQFDEADITDLESFRKAQKEEATAKGVRLTALAFLMKAAVAALREFPDVNSSLDPSGEGLIVKKYYHLGIAVDTPNGLVVPVVRDVDQKGVYELAVELAEVSSRARDGKLTPRDIQGASFSISSLGGIGGTGFTPIVNAPEVAILGVARSRWQPVYRDGEFVPRLVLPFSLSYDHRVIDGAAAVRFTGFLSQVLTDVRRLLL